MKTCGSRVSSFTSEIHQARARPPTRVLATPATSRFCQLPATTGSTVRQLPSSIIRNDMSLLGEGSFGKCYRGLLQGMPVCIKHLKSPKVEQIMKEASILSKLIHPTVCFIHGVQIEKPPYYIVTNIYLIEEQSITICDFLCPPNSVVKFNIVQCLQSKMVANDWCRVLKNIVEGLSFIHSQNIIHRDLKSNNVVLYQECNTLRPVLINFSKALLTPTFVKYILTDAEKQQYRKNHKHIAPDLIDGINSPSSSGDMYSFGRMCKNIICYVKIDLALFNEHTLSMIKKCLKYNYKERPTAAEAVASLASNIEQLTLDA